MSEGQFKPLLDECIALLSSVANYFRMPTTRQLAALPLLRTPERVTNDALLSMGYASLALIVLPVVVRTTDEMLRLVPTQMREAALSLGVPQWKVTTQVLYRASLPGIVTGILLALARISGETAPLLFTALNNQYWTTDLSAPMANVPVVIFQYAMSPYDNWHSLAWAGAFFLTLFVLLVGLAARAIVSRHRMTHD